MPLCVKLTLKPKRVNISGVLIVIKEEEKILDYFSLLKKRRILGTSYLFIGDNFSLVKGVVKLISCSENALFCDICWDCERINSENHPDLFLIEPQNFSITIKRIKESQGFLQLKSFHSKKKVLIIKGGENLGHEAAGAFLKTLEEPPKNSFIAICVSKLEGLLPTIVSRCRKIFLPFKQTEIDSSSIRLVSHFLNGERIKFKNRKEFSHFLWTLIVSLRDYFVFQTTNGNNHLLKTRENQDFLKPYRPEEMEGILGDILKIYSMRNNINENLALNLIKMKL